MRGCLKQLIIYISGVLLLWGCKNDDCPPEKDPCASKYPEEIKIVNYSIEKYGPNGLLDDKGQFAYSVYPYDSFVSPTRTKFGVNFEYDSAFWLFGTDPRVKQGNLVYIEFNSPYGKIDIQCIGYRPVDTDCFGPNDDGVDTFQKSIWIMDRWDSPLFGTYRGVHEGETDTFEIALVKEKKYQIPGDTTSLSYFDYYFTGIPKQGELKMQGALEWYRFFWR